jgi:hypothetical protein
MLPSPIGPSPGFIGRDLTEIADVLVATYAQ